MKPIYEIVVFDIDGTLLKSELGAMNALRYTTDKMGIPFPSEEVQRKFIGPPLHYNFHELMGMSEEDTVRAIDIFNEYYLPKGTFEAEIYPGLMELVKELYSQGIKVCIATAKSKAMADQVVGHFGILPYLTHMETTPDSEATSEKKVLLSRILKATGTPAEKGVMIGDTLYDAEGAIQNGMPFIGVTYGYGTREAMESVGARAFAKDAQELRALLFR